LPVGFVSDAAKSLPNFAAYDGKRDGHVSGTAVAPPAISVTTTTNPAPSAGASSPYQAE